MNNSYVIQWKSKSNGRAGRGTKRFDKEEAERLVEELNREYPQIEHEAVAVAAAESTPADEATAQEIPVTTTPMLSIA
jgi:hypothetical protein